MLSVLMFFAGAIISEAGVPRQPNSGYGLHHQLTSRPVVRPDLIRSHILPPIGLSLNTPGPIFRSTLFAPPLLVNPLQFGYKAIPPLTLSHVAPPIQHPSINQYAISSAPTITRIISPPTVLNPTPISHAVIGPAQSSRTIPENSKNFQEVPEKFVSYSLSENDYQFLKRHKTEGQDSPYNPVHGLDTASESEKHQNSHIHDIKDRTASKKLLKSDIVLKKSIASNGGYEVYNEPSIIQVSEPLVTKDIYFHVPPPDFEEPPPVSISLPLPKKTYNLVFIKVPAQEQKNYAFLQQFLQSRPSQIEDKTLIYVLSKKQDPPPQVVLSPQRISSPEVFFVNYKTNSGNITTQISNELVEERVIENNSPVLERKRSLEDSQFVNFSDN